MKQASSPRPPAQVTYPTIVGKALAFIRNERGYTQADVAAVLELTQPAYSRLEAGSSILSIMQLRQAADAVGVNAIDILQKADEIEDQLRRYGVEIVQARQEGTTAPLAIGLGLLAGLLLKS